jgi:hypothetical protein
MNAIADRTILSAFSARGICWVFGSLFRQVLVAPSTDFRLACALNFLQADLNSHELHRALSLRRADIWTGASCDNYTRCGLPADTAECLAIAEHRDIPVLTDSAAAHAYNHANGKLQLLDSDIILEQAAQHGLIEEPMAWKCRRH